MNKIIEEIINAVESQESPNCFGEAGAPYAEQLVKAQFEKEGVPYDGWEVDQIPMVSRKGGYNVAVVVYVANYELRKTFALNFMIDGEFVGTTALFHDPEKIILGDDDRADLDGIREAIEHDFSNYPSELL